MRLQRSYPLSDSGGVSYGQRNPVPPTPGLRDDSCRWHRRPLRIPPAEPRSLGPGSSYSSPRIRSETSSPSSRSAAARPAHPGRIPETQGCPQARRGQTADDCSKPNRADGRGSLFLTTYPASGGSKLPTPSVLPAAAAPVSLSARDRRLYSQSYSIPISLHLLSTSALVLASIRISSGQGRLKPSVGHLRVASMPIFEPKFGSREAWSSDSTGPHLNSISPSRSMWLKSVRTTSPMSCTFTSSSSTTMHLITMAWPRAQMPFITLRAWPGYDFRLDTIIRLWKMPSTGKFTSTISGNVSFIMGRKLRSTALPIQPSSIGGVPTIVVE